jgi:hypothetical protein
VKESVGFLHRIHRDSCAASDVAHTELLFIVLPTSERQDTSRIDGFALRASLHCTRMKGFASRATHSP